jgi:hypothetical protein
VRPALVLIAVTQALENGEESVNHMEQIAMDIGALLTSQLSKTNLMALDYRSIAVSSNIHPSGLTPSSMATATVDQLLRHAHVVITTRPRTAPRQRWCGRVVEFVRKRALALGRYDYECMPTAVGVNACGGLEGERRLSLG